MRQQLVVPMAAVLVMGTAAAALFHAGLTRLPEVDAHAGAEPPLELEAEVLKRSIKVGERLPVEFRLKSRARRPVWVLPELDGSDAGLRFPRCTLEIRDARGTDQAPAPVPRWEPPAPLAAEDFLRLPPGGRTGPLGHPHLAWRPSRAGTYTVRFTYDAGPRDARAWATPAGPPRPGALDRLSAMPRGVLSAEATVVVEE